MRVSTLILLFALVLASLSFLVFSQSSVQVSNLWEWSFGVSVSWSQLRFRVFGANLYPMTFTFTYDGDPSFYGYPNANIDVYLVLPDGSKRLYRSIPVRDSASIKLVALKTYEVVIPASGSTTRGYLFELVSYSVNGVQGSGNVFRVYSNRAFDVQVRFRLYQPATGTPTTTTYVVSVPINITIPTFQIAPPAFPVGAPAVLTPEALILLALFAGLVVAYSRVMSLGQAIAVASAISLPISIVLLGNQLVVIFIVGFAIGIALWRVLGR